MKILNCFLDNRFGGPQSRAYSVAGKLKEHNIETVFLFNEKLKGTIPIQYFKCYLLRRLQCLTRNATVINLFFFCLYLPYNLYKIRKIIKLERVDIVHTNGITNILPALAARLSGAKVVWHLNDTMTPGIVRRLLRPFVEAFSDKIALAADKVREHYFSGNGSSSNKFATLYAPVDINRFDPDLVNREETKELKKQLGLRDNDLIIGSVGNINMQKGYEYFIKAAKTIKERREDAKFLIVGARLTTKQEYWHRLQDLTFSLGLKSDIIFLDFREDMPQILSLFDVFVLSSVSEACPITVLEAMSMKVPVVATDVGGVCEQIADGESGIMIQPRSDNAIAEGILRVLSLSGQAKEEMVNKARSKARDIFSLDLIAQRHKDIYEAIGSN